MKHLKKFETINDHNDYKKTKYFYLPNVSLIKNNNTIMYNNQENSIFKCKFYTNENNNYPFDYPLNQTFSTLKIDGVDKYVNNNITKKTFTINPSEISLNDGSLINYYFDNVISYTIKTSKNYKSVDFDDLSIVLISTIFISSEPSIEEISFYKALSDDIIEIDETNMSIRFNINALHKKYIFIYPSIIFLKYQGTYVETVITCEVLDYPSNTQTITCLPSEYNLSYDSDNDKILGTAPLDNFFNLNDIKSLKITSSKEVSPSNYMLLLDGGDIDATNSDSLTTFPLAAISIYDAIETGVVTYNEENYTLEFNTSSSVSNYPPITEDMLLTIVLAEDLNSDYISVIDTTIIVDIYESRKIECLASEIKCLDESYEIYSIPNTYHVYNPRTLLIKPLNEDIELSRDFTLKVFFENQIFNEFSCSLLIDNKNKINKASNMFILSLFSTAGLFIFNKKITYMLADENGNLIDTIVQTCDNKNYLNDYILDIHKEHTVEFSMFNSKTCPSFIYNSTLKDISIPNSITNITPLSFYNCTSLQTVKLPKNIKSLESISNKDDFGHIYYKGIFERCSSLTFIKCNATTAPEIDAYTFRDISPTGTLYYPNGSDYSSWIAKLPSGWKSETF